MVPFNLMRRFNKKILPILYIGLVAIRLGYSEDRKIAKEIGYSGADHGISLWVSNYGCFDYPNYFIRKSRSRRMFIKKKNNKGQVFECDSLSPFDFTIDFEDDESFSGIFKEFLFADVGSSTFARSFKVYDLDKRKWVYSGGYSREPHINDGNINYWSISNRGNKEEICEGRSTSHSQATLEVYEKETFDLSNLKVIHSGDFKCTEVFWP